MADRPVLAVLVGNRGFFPDWLVEEGRRRVLDALERLDIATVCLSTKDTPLGGVESLEDARKCAALFQEHRARIDGVLITLPNFGDERAAANALRWAGLGVPVLVHAFPDDVERLDLKNRRDAFCGKVSVCNNLTQYGIPFSLTTHHTESPETAQFRDDVLRFVSVCRVVKGLRSARVGALGARTGPFNTVRYSEKILEANGISVETLDLSEVLGWIERLEDDDAAVRRKVENLGAYAASEGCTEEGILRMAKFAAVVERWVKENALNALCVQCWTSIEENFGIVPCGVMSMMSEGLVPSACEVDVMGALSMYALQLASGQPSAIVDWNNNYGDDPDAVLFFHCSNLPRSCFRCARMGVQDIISQSVGRENAAGTIIGIMREGPITFARLSTDDTAGEVVGYVGEGEVLADEPKSFGGYGAARIGGLQDLMQFICRSGFEHHVALTYAQVADVLDEALTAYMGWDIYRHM